MKEIVLNRTKEITDKCAFHFDFDKESVDSFQGMIKDQLEIFKSELIQHIAKHVVIDE